MSDSNKHTILNKLFRFIERLAFKHSLVVVAVSVILAGLSIWVTAEKLTFKTGRGDLVAKGLPYVKLYEEYRDQFEDLEGMVIVAESESPAKMAEFAEALAAKLQVRPDLFSQVIYKFDTSYFRSRFLLYLDPPDLKSLQEKLEEHQDFIESINNAPGLNPLLNEINREISSGMVDSLMTDFLGEGDAEEEEKNDENDLNLLIRIIEEINRSLGKKYYYQSPWQSLFNSGEESLRDKGYLVSKNEKLLFILAVPNEDETSFTGYKASVYSARELIAEVKKDFPSISVGLTGEDVISTDEMITTQKDVELASKIALGGVALLFIIAFKGIVKPLLAVFSLLVALAWSLGFTSLTVGHLNILSVVFTTILIGLGIDFGIHILGRYKEERQEGNDISSALQKTLQGTGQGNFSGAITTAMAFGAMVLTDFIGIVELGWIAGWGILFCMIAMVLLLPALVTLEEKWRKPVYSKSAEKPITASINWLDRFFNHYKLIITVCCVLVLMASLSLRTVHFDYNLLNLQTKGTEAVKYEMRILENAGRSAWSAAMLADSLEEVRQKEKQLKTLPTIENVESISAMVPKHQEENLQYVREKLSPLLSELYVEEEDEPFSLKGLTKTLKRIRFKLQGREGKEDKVAQAAREIDKFLETHKTIEQELAEKKLAEFSEELFVDYRGLMADLKKNAEPELVEISEIPKNLRDRYISKQGKYLITIFPSVDIWNLDERKRYLKDLRSVDANVTGSAVHMFNSTRLMTEGYINGGIYAMTAIIIYVFIVFRNPRTVFFILLPVIAGSIWTVGIMELTGLKLNMANLVILPLILGIGVVNGIHITHRYREEKDKNAVVLGKSTGQAVILSSLTTMIGFGSMMVADHYGVFSLGLVLTLGVFCCLIASITFLPALLKLSAAKGWKV
ncbi:MAG: hopanoid biosynthesis associated RND transporter like protein HpnN [Nitrospinales bacterium]|jgi:hopanoid biosynthesis associated RND transporter like protein HpnN